jgi:hypothetical protein
VYEDWYREPAKGPHAEKPRRLADIVTPDELPSHSYIEVVPQGPYLAWIIEVKNDYGKRLGAIVISARGSDPVTGRLNAHGVSTFTNEEISPCPE